MESPPNCQLGAKIRIKAEDLLNLTGKVTEIKRGGWYMTDNPKIRRPVRAREFDFIDDDDTETDDADADDVKSGAAAATKNHDGDDGDKDPFFKVGTTIKITSGEHMGKICNISERHCGIFLKVTEFEDRIIRTDEVEVVKFAKKNPSDSKEEEEEEDKKKKTKSFGHEKYVGATVLVTVPDKKRPVKAEVAKAFSGEWYLVDDPTVVKALGRDQFEVVEDSLAADGGVRGGNRKRDEAEEEDGEEDGGVRSKSSTSRKKSPRKRRYNSDSDEEEEEEEEEEEDDDDDEEEDDDEFLSNMQYCAAAADAAPSPSLRKRKKRVNYAEDNESIDEESWEGSEGEEDENEDEDSEVEIVDDKDDDEAVVNTKSKPAPAPSSPVMDSKKSSEDAKAGEDNDGSGSAKVEDQTTIHAPVTLHQETVGSKVNLLLSGVSHLPADTKIEIFNRKTGRIMRGDEAVLLKDLPAVLLDHAEYEPIVPPRQTPLEPEADDNAEANTATVTPSPRNPKDERQILVGVTAVVKYGQFKGLSGKIKQVKERGWWILDNDAITKAVKSDMCHFVDDGEVDKGAIIAHYQSKKAKTRMPSFVRPGSVKVSGNNDVATAAKVSRVGRTGSNVRVSNVVIPQTVPNTRPLTRVRGSAIEGKRVLVTGGEYRGLSGTISSCIPGGWYLVSNLYEDDDQLDVLIHSEKLELISNVSSRMLPGQNESRQIMSRIHLKASELRLSALREKKQKALEDLNNETDKRTRKYLDDIEEEMESLTTKIAAFRQGSSA